MCRGLAVENPSQSKGNFGQLGPDVGNEVKQQEPCEEEKSPGPAGLIDGEGGKQQARGTADEAEDLQRNATHPLDEKDRTDDADDQKRLDEGRPVGGKDVVVDDGGQIMRVIGLVADGCGENGRG